MSKVENIIREMRSQHLIEKYNLHKVGIFGSSLTSEIPNDLDILVESYANYKDLLSFKKEMEAIAGMPVDIVISKYASPIILHRAHKNIIYV